MSPLKFALYHVPCTIVSLTWASRPCSTPPQVWQDHFREALPSVTGRHLLRLCQQTRATFRTTTACQMLLLLTATMFVARPNVLLLFADDWGWGDLGANHDPNPHPHLHPHPHPNSNPHPKPNATLSLSLTPTLTLTKAPTGRRQQG